MSIKGRSSVPYQASKLLEALQAKHAKDVFVAECKDGPTQSVSEYSRMDAWVMNRSWKNRCYTAYEIKVSRSDFLSDTKWRNYLPYCNQFYFVAPKGLIDPSELSPEAGLLELLGGIDGKRLVRRKNAPFREIPTPSLVLEYVLMCRTVVSRNEYLAQQTKEERADVWREFVAERVDQRKLGRQVAKAIRETVQDRERENKRLIDRMDDYDDIRGWLRHAGIDPDDRISRWTIEDRLKEQEALFPREFMWAMKSLRDALDRSLKQAEPEVQELANQL